jgi:hypothetical protein
MRGESKIKILTILLVSLIVFCNLPSGFAQAPREEMAMRMVIAMKIVQVRKENAALTRQYTWNSRTELIDQGVLKDTRIEMVGYGSDGQVIRTPLNDFSAPLPRGFLRRAIAEQEKQKMEDYMTGLRGFLDQYTLPTAGKVLDFVSQAKISPPDASGLLYLNGNNVVVPGDTFSLWVEATTLQTSKIEVETFFQGDIVVVTSTSKRLPNGPTYMAYTDVTIAVKQLRLQIHNYDYSRIALPPPPPIQERQLSPSITEMEIKSPASPPAAKAAPGSPSLQAIEQKLRDLKALLDQGLITQSDYDAKKTQILQGL